MPLFWPRRSMCPCMSRVVISVVVVRGSAGGVCSASCTSVDAGAMILKSSMRERVNCL